MGRLRDGDPALGASHAAVLLSPFYDALGALALAGSLTCLEEVVHDLNYDPLFRRARKSTILSTKPNMARPRITFGGINSKPT